MAHFGQALRHLREQHQITQVELSVAAGLSQGGISIVESKHDRPSRRHTAQAIINGLQCLGLDWVDTLDDIVEWNRVETGDL